MDKIIINGPCKIKGKVKVQGAKNSAMKHIFTPLISEGVYTFKNIPKINTIQNLLEIVKLQGCKVRWDKNTLIIDSNGMGKNPIIPEELFYYTSGGINPIPILVSKYGKCTIQIDTKRRDRGGDQLGSRNIQEIVKTLKLCGISTNEKGDILEFKLTSENPIDFEVPVRSFSASMLGVLSALFKKGKSNITNYTKAPEFDDIINCLIVAGAKIVVKKDKLEIMGFSGLKGIDYTNTSDPHDFVTFLSAALTTNSEIELLNVDFQRMNLKYLYPTFYKMHIDLDIKKHSISVAPQLKNIKPYNIIAGNAPLFVTEWQVLLSPLLIQLKGESSVIETLYSNRMRHWEELGKMGVKFTYFKNSKYPEANGNPRAVKLTGPQKLKGAEVIAKDVRSGAAIVIAGLVADGKTSIVGVDNIDRGYENLVGRLQSLGADIKIVH